MNVRRLIFGILLIVFALFLLDLMMALLNPPEETTVRIGGDGSYCYQVSLMGEDVIEGEYEVLDGTVNFFICDKENYNEYRASGSYDDILAYLLKENSTGYTFSFELPENDPWYETGKWYVVYDATYSPANETVVDSTIECEAYGNLVSYLKIVIVVIAGVSIVVAVLPEKKDKKKDGTKAGESESRSKICDDPMAPSEPVPPEPSAPDPSAQHSQSSTSPSSESPASAPPQEEESDPALRVAPPADSVDGE